MPSLRVDLGVSKELEVEVDFFLIEEEKRYRARWRNGLEKVFESSTLE